MRLTIKHWAFVAWCIGVIFVAGATYREVKHLSETVELIRDNYATTRQLKELHEYVDHELDEVRGGENE